MTNTRFHGAWTLQAFETENPDGTTTPVWKSAPQGIICWDKTNYFSAQLGPSVPDPETPYVAYFGVIEAPDGEKGTMIHHVLASARPETLHGQQVRHFEFVDNDNLILRPPPSPDGISRRLVWKRKGDGTFPPTYS